MRLTAWKAVWKTGDNFNVTWDGKMVQDPYLAAMIAIFALTTVLTMIAIAVLTIPLWVPIDVVLHACGLNGFFRGDQVTFDLDSFRRR